MKRRRTDRDRRDPAESPLPDPGEILPDLPTAAILGAEIPLPIPDDEPSVEDDRRVAEGRPPMQGD
jgi:hypothetical protein